MIEGMGALEVFGIWLSIFLTFSILSFLYEDNPVYKLAEHVFMGVGIGIGTVEAWYGVFKPKLVDRLLEEQHLWSLIPLVLLILLFFKLVPSLADWARIPIAFIVAAFAGVKLTGEANGRLVAQVSATMPDLPALYEKHGWWSWEADGAGVISGLILVLGLCACLLHFYFSAPHNRPMRAISRVGILVLMLSFGASFGFTVMGRISLAIGRAEDLLGFSQPEALITVAGTEMTRMSAVRILTVLTLLAMIAALAVWKMRGGGAQHESPSESSAQ